LQRKFRVLYEGRQATVTPMHASRYRTEVFDGRRVGTAFDTFLNYLRRGRTHEDLWLAVLVRHPTATQSELDVAGAASADVIRYEKRQVGDSGYAATLEQKTRDTRPKKFGAYAGPSQLAAEQLSASHTRETKCERM
jgi:hypothetical protein